MVSDLGISMLVIANNDCWKMIGLYLEWLVFGLGCIWNGLWGMFCREVISLV